MGAFFLINLDNKQTSSLVLGIETSCDETSAAVVRDGRTILSNVISSQIPVHQKFGGVVPEIASRKHIEQVIPVIDQALLAANVTLDQLTAIGVTYGPGLVGALLVGLSAAKALAFAKSLPLVGVHHLESHIFANLLAHQDLEPPFLALVVSGGHTSLVKVASYNQFILIGQTRDDAAGEAFDKIARVMGLPYPGGPYIDQLARQGNSTAIHFPRALNGHGNFEFSFSGLKSAVLNYLNSAQQKGETVVREDVAASFQAAIVDVLVEKTLQAAAVYGLGKIVLAGGVAANSSLQQRLASELGAKNLRFYYPPSVLCTDNAAMVACRAHYQFQAGLTAPLTLNARPTMRLGQSLGEKK